MKKIVALLLILSTPFMQSVSFNEKCRKAFYILFDPVKSLDDKANKELKFYHTNVFAKDHETIYIFKDLDFSRSIGTAGNFRKYFPKDDSASIDKLTKAIILKRHDRLMEKDEILKACDADYESIWQQQPLKDRLWWTIQYRKPWLSLLKWSTESALAAGASYGIYRLVKEYKKRAQAKLHISA